MTLPDNAAADVARGPVADLIAALGIRPDERLPIRLARPDGQGSTRTVLAADAQSVIDAEAEGCNAYVGINPTELAEGTRREGTAAQIARVVAVFADLDAKPGGCEDMATVDAIIEDLAGLLETRPVAVIFSGGGKQPIWAVEDLGTVGEGQALARRFGRLVARVAEARGAKVDSVFNVDRILRAPGTVNYKYDPPVEAALILDTGAPMAASALAELLDAYGIGSEAADGQLGDAAIVAPEANWPYAADSCGYAAQTCKRWMSDAVTERHPWLLRCFVRLECMRRYGCLTRADYLRHAAALERRFGQLLAHPPARAVKRFEVAEIRSAATGIAARKSETELDSELGAHVHLSAPPVQSPAPVADHAPAAPTVPALAAEAEPLAASPTPDAAEDPFELAVTSRADSLRIDREARRRLDEAERPPLILPPIKTLTDLLAEPDDAAKYLLDGLAPSGGRVMLSAAFKAGKTTAIGNLIRSLADGDEFLGHFKVSQRKNRIVLVDNELSETMLRQWLREQRVENVEAVSIVSLRGRVSTFDLLDKRCREMWAKALRDLGADYLILDCLRPVLDALGLDENRDARRFLVPFDELLADAGIPEALVVQHMGHQNERSRGDSRLQDWPDVLWKLVRLDDDPASPRFFSAFGRDVDIPEGRLDYDPAQRRLILAGGSRVNAAAEAALPTVLEILAADALAGGSGLSGRGVVAAGADSDHARDTLRAALGLAVRREYVTTASGPRGATVHRIANPCDGCGLPVAAGLGERHLTCVPRQLLGGVE